MVNGKTIDKSGKKFPEDIEILLGEQELPWVSRAALKLIAALDHWNIEVIDKIALDIGASTGGFTQVLLERYVRKVYAIDVGTDQLAEVIKSDQRVINLEQTNFRHFHSNHLEEKAEIAVIDVSFISQVLLYPALLDCLKEGADVISLVKPQFEAGKEKIGKGGIIREQSVRRAVVNNTMEKAKEAGLAINGLIPSPIKGGDGNEEFLLYMSTKKKT